MLRCFFFGRCRSVFLFFFQAEDGIRDHCVTGVQTCALPICRCSSAPSTCLGFKVEGADEHLLHIDVTAFKKMIKAAVKTFPNFAATATTLRAAKTATVNNRSEERRVGKECRARWSRNK